MQRDADTPLAAQPHPEVSLAGPGPRWRGMCSAQGTSRDGSRGVESTGRPHRLRKRVRGGQAGGCARRRHAVSPSRRPMMCPKRPVDWLGHVGASHRPDLRPGERLGEDVRPFIRATLRPPSKAAIRSANSFPRGTRPGWWRPHSWSRRTRTQPARSGRAGPRLRVAESVAEATGRPAFGRGGAGF